MYELKIEKWQQAYTNHCLAQNKSHETIKSYWGEVIVFLKHFNTTSPDRLTYQQILAYLVKFQNSSTFSHKKYGIKLFYEVCLNQPQKLIKLPKRKHERTIPEILNPQEVFAILHQVKNLKHKAILQIGYSCGLRIGEVKRIRIKDIDGQNRILFVQQSKGKKDRRVPIPEDTLVLLRCYFKEYLSGNYKPTDFLFTGQSKTTESYSTGSMRAILKRAAIAVGILKKIKFHTLRHSRATHLKNAGMDIRDLADFLGHENTKTTEIYLHTGIEDLQQKVMRFDREIVRDLKIATKHNLLPFTTTTPTVLNHNRPTIEPSTRMRFAPRQTPKQELIT